MSEIYDVIILGAGPAGLAAGLYAGRSRLNVLIIEKGQDGGQIAITDEIENYPGQIVEGESGPSLIARMTEQAEKFGAKRVSDMIKEVELEGEVKVLIEVRISANNCCNNLCFIFKILCQCQTRSYNFPNTNFCRIVCFFLSTNLCKELVDIMNYFYLRHILILPLLSCTQLIETCLICCTCDDLKFYFKRSIFAKCIFTCSGDLCHII
jgi:hypothetical protein